MAERAPLPDLETVWAELLRELFALIDEHLEPFADALKAIEELTARGVKIAVASSSVRERLDRTLARAGLQFEITIAGDEVEHSKPAPDMFRSRRSVWGCRPSAAPSSRTPVRASPRAPPPGCRRSASAASREPRRRSPRRTASSTK